MTVFVTPSESLTIYDESDLSGPVPYDQSVDFYAEYKDGITNLQMIDVDDVQSFESHCFLNTGSPHHVQKVKNIGIFQTDALAVTTYLSGRLSKSIAKPFLAR